MCVECQKWRYVLQRKPHFLPSPPGTLISLHIATATRLPFIISCSITITHYHVGLGQRISFVKINTAADIYSFHPRLQHHIIFPISNNTKHGWLHRMMHDTRKNHLITWINQLSYGFQWGVITHPCPRAYGHIPYFYVDVILLIHALT